MTEPVLIAIIIAAPPTLAVLGTSIFSYLDRRKKAAEATRQTAEIHVLVDGRLSEALDKIGRLEAQLQSLHVRPES
jgi:hypothetical protein